MKRFFPYLRYLKPVKWQFAGGLLAGIMYAAASGLGLPLAVKVLFPLVFDGGGEEDGQLSGYFAWMRSFLGNMEHGHLVLLSCLWLPIIFLFRALGGFFSAYLITYCGFRVVEQIRCRVFERLQQLPIAFFQKYQSGDLLARVMADPDGVRYIVTQVSSELIKQPATLIFALGFMITEAFRNEGTFVVFVALMTIPICVFPIRAAGKKLGRRAKEVANAGGELAGQVTESLQAPVEIRAYNLQQSHVEKLRVKLKELIRLSMKLVKYNQMISPAIEVVAVTGLSFALYLGVQRGMTLDSFTAIGIALYIAYEPIKKLGGVHVALRQGEASLDRIEVILNAEGELPEPANPKSPEKFVGEVRFEKVKFSYGHEDVLSDIDTAIAPGECVALVGPSGAGKSTFANLIPRFFDVTEGKVLVSGIDVRDWNKKVLRGQVAIVSQTPILFSGTIEENILLGRPGATQEEVVEAAKKAYAHDFIMEQEYGYNHWVSEKGTSLSGGQRQRIAIARAFLKDAPLLILDEATSALDNESEAKIQEALKVLIRDRTTIIIAHRLSTTRIADRVLEFDRGKLIAERKPSELEG